MYAYFDMCMNMCIIYIYIYIVHLMLNAIPRWVQRMKCPSTTIMNVSIHDGYLHVPHLHCNKAPPKRNGPWWSMVLLHFSQRQGIRATPYKDFSLWTSIRPGIWGSDVPLPNLVTGYENPLTRGVYFGGSNGENRLLKLLIQCWVSNDSVLCKRLRVCV